MTLSVAAEERSWVIRRDGPRAGGFRARAWGRQGKNEFIS